MAPGFAPAHRYRWLTRVHSRPRGDKDRRTAATQSVRELDHHG